MQICRHPFPPFPRYAKLKTNQNPSPKQKQKQMSLCLLPCFALFLTYVCMYVCMYACVCVCECVCCLPFRRLCLISFFTPVPFVPFVLLSRALSHYRLFPNLFLPPAPHGWDSAAPSSKCRPLRRSVHD
ncbi:uncharacterized protein K444DRAFT_22291 [Hyaloscypha bicolor E]|uniref:Uncharacterized protein n=1 Tax=Hyaloscypha bicolor E TaxID=1095630 RepID=A0A2J6T4L5_9HELO|nr:uncharacterized protein K444DRAFT_22291 [Hyaloscypha bicolor E]PMD57959.1 hypothetical protein K444DRAFT_22291 [Hyaloscypha bicolor E]